MMGLDNIDEATVQALNDLFAQIEPVMQQMIETREKMQQIGMELPEGYAEGISDYAALGAVADNATAIFELAGEVTASSPELQQTIQEWNDSGTELPDGFITGIRGKDAEVESNIREMALKINRYSKTYLGQPIEVDIPMNLNIKAKVSGNSTLSGNVPGTNIPYPTTAHATGGIFDTPHVALFAEAGPEAVIPINNTENAYNLWKQTGE